VCSRTNVNLIINFFHFRSNLFTWEISILKEVISPHPRPHTSPTPRPPLALELAPTQVFFYLGLRQERVTLRPWPRPTWRSAIARTVKPGLSRILRPLQTFSKVFFSFFIIFRAYCQYGSVTNSSSTCEHA
jgi:hypothetical protein